jgi:hypothetical protein
MDQSIAPRGENAHVMETERSNRNAKTPNDFPALTRVCSITVGREELPRSR